MGHGAYALILVRNPEDKRRAGKVGKALLRQMAEADGIPYQEPRVETLGEYVADTAGTMAQGRLGWQAKNPGKRWPHAPFNAAAWTKKWRKDMGKAFALVIRSNPKRVIPPGRARRRLAAPSPPPA